MMDAGGWVTVQAAMGYQHSTEKRREVTLQMPYSAPAWPLKENWKFRGPSRQQPLLGPESEVFSSCPNYTSLSC